MHLFYIYFYLGRKLVPNTLNSFVEAYLETIWCANRYINQLLFIKVNPTYNLMFTKHTMHHHSIAQYADTK